MRLLILSQWYLPENVSGKITSIGSDLSKENYLVKCLTGYPNYPKGELYPGYKIKLLFKEIIDSVQVIRLPLFIDHSNSKVKRIMNYLSLALSSLILGPFIVGKNDAVILYDSILSMSLSALFICKLKKIPFIFEIQDMYPETLKAIGMIKSKMILALIEKYVKYLCKRADVITVISKGFKYNLISKGIDGNKIKIIPNWADVKLFHPEKKNIELAAKYNIENSFNIMYAGNLGKAQDLQYFVRAGKYIKKNINIIIIGDGLDKNKLENIVNKEKINNVKIISSKSMNDINKYLNLADVLFLHLKDEPLFSITIPSKLIAYLAIGKPLICAVNGEASEIVKNSNSGIVCVPEDTQSIVNAIEDISGYDKMKLEKLGHNARNYYLEYYDKKILINEYKKIFSKIAKVN